MGVRYIQIFVYSVYQSLFYVNFPSTINLIFKKKGRKTFLKIVEMKNDLNIVHGSKICRAVH